MSLLHPMYIGLAISNSKCSFFINNINQWKYELVDIQNGENVVETIITYLKKYETDFNSKIIIIGINGDEKVTPLTKLCSRIWNELDIVPCIFDGRGSLNDIACSVSRKSMTLMVSEHNQIPGIIQILTGMYHNVQIDGNGKIVLAELNDYKRFVDNEMWNELLNTSNECAKRNKKIVFFNSTAQGGGVAIIRNSSMRLYKLLGIDAEWFVLKPSPDVFNTTKKKFHNVLQGITNDALSDQEKTQWQEWCEDNITEYWMDSDIIQHADVIVIDDPQPCGLIPKLKELNKSAKIVYRSHIELRSDLINDNTTVQQETWNYLYSFIRQADLFVSHPVQKFIPANIDLPIKTMPAITDPIDGLNKPLSKHSIDYYRILFNRIYTDQSVINGYCAVGSCKEVDFSRPYFIQICRFDPSKGIPDLIEAYDTFRKHNQGKSSDDNRDIPQLIVTGQGSIDDPEGHSMYTQMVDIASRSEYALDIHITSIGPCDQLLNMLLRGALCAFQLSIREGYEIKVTEALLKGVPVIAYKTGGIPLQITNGFDGFLVDTGNTDKVAELMSEIIKDREFYSSNAKSKNRQHLLTPMNIIAWNKILLDC